MASLCGICHTEASRYKCPKCYVPYCSLTCYKPHKTAHTEEPPTVTPYADTEEQGHDDFDAPAPQGYKSWPPDFYALPTNPQFQALMKQYPNLKIQLGGVFLKTLEPPPQDSNTGQANGSSARNPWRGRGRGRARGGYRGGRGGSYTPQKWTRERGDKNALFALQKLISKGSAEDDGVRAFIGLISKLYEEEKITD